MWKNCSWFLTKGDEQCRDCPMGKGNPAIPSSDSPWTNLPCFTHVVLFVATHYTDHPMTALHVPPTCAEEGPPGYLTGWLFLILCTARSASPTTPTTHSPWMAWTELPPTTPCPHPGLPLSELFCTHGLINIWKGNSYDVPNQKPSMTSLCLNDKAQPPNTGCYGLN